MKKEEKVLFEVGDVVKIKSGGPLMTVQSIGASSLSLITKMAYDINDRDDGLINCVWFDGAIKHTGHFQPGALISCE